MIVSKPFPIKSQKGTSLIEVMVASTVLGAVIIGVVAILRTTRELEYNVHLGRKARIAAESILESYSYRNYESINVGWEPLPPAVVLDERAGNPISATSTIYVSGTSSWQGQTVEAKTILMTLSWTSPFSITENTLSFEKCIAKIH
jgi:hypothetical protein